MNLALIGYGKMGRMLDHLAPEYGFTVTARVENTGQIATIRDTPVAIEFANAKAVTTNIEALASAGIHVVEGTTGWLGSLAQIQDSVRKHGIGMVWSPNYSVGVNVFSRLGARSRPLASE